MAEEVEIITSVVEAEEILVESITVEVTISVAVVAWIEVAEEDLGKSTSHIKLCIENLCLY